MAPKTFIVSIITGAKKNVVFDDNKTVQELAIEISKALKIPYDKLDLTVKGYAGFLSFREYDLIKDVPVLKNDTVELYAVVTKEQRFSEPIFSEPKSSEPVENIPCGGKRRNRRKSRKTKKSRRQTRKRGGAMMTKTMVELWSDLRAPGADRGTLENVLSDLLVSGNPTLESVARGTRRRLDLPLRGRETMDSRVQRTIDDLAGSIALYGMGF